MVPYHRISQRLSKRELRHVKVQTNEANEDVSTIIEGSEKRRPFPNLKFLSVVGTSCFNGLGEDVELGLYRDVTCRVGAAVGHVAHYSEVA